MSNNCIVQINPIQKANFNTAGEIFTGPDLNGDGNADRISTVTFSTMWSGDRNACQSKISKLLTERIGEHIKVDNGRFYVKFKSLQAVSTRGMEKLSGKNWRDFKSAGSITINGGMSVFNGVVNIRELARSNISATDIANSQLRGAVIIPMPGGKEIHIGSKIHIKYKNGKVMRSTVINISGLYYFMHRGMRKHQLVPGLVKLTVVPEGENALNKSFNVDLLSKDNSYTITVVS